jgi:hypothetical protein
LRTSLCEIELHLPHRPCVLVGIAHVRGACCVFTLRQYACGCLSHFDLGHSCQFMDVQCRLRLPLGHSQLQILGLRIIADKRHKGIQRNKPRAGGQGKREGDPLVFRPELS